MAQKEKEVQECLSKISSLDGDLVVARQNLQNAHVDLENFRRLNEVRPQSVDASESQGQEEENIEFFRSKLIQAE